MGKLKEYFKNKKHHRDYLWPSKEQLIGAKVSWKECCLNKKFGILGIVNHEVAKTNLLCK